MSSSQSRSPSIGDGPDQWVRNRIEYQSETHGDATQGAGQTQNVIVEDDVERIECDQNTRLGSGAHAIPKLDPGVERLQSGIRCGHLYSGYHISNGYEESVVTA